MPALKRGEAGFGVVIHEGRFTYQQEGNDPENHAIHATLPIPVPEGGVGRVLIYKTYKDPRTYMLHGDDIVSHLLSAEVDDEQSADVRLGTAQGHRARHGRSS